MLEGCFWTLLKLLKLSDIYIFEINKPTDKIKSPEIAKIK